MNVFHRRTRFRLSLLAIVALLWSQLAFAVHPGCAEALDAALAAASVVETTAQGCEHHTPPEQDPVCHAYCAQGEASSDTARVPPVPPLLGLLAVPEMVPSAATAAAMDARAVQHPLPAVKRRPTAHPAELLLI
ncbi:hypothetical protein [Luteimonas mephitis]|uniref:hypothetical protein n=1 Tax=Luteimonas mephitis TaxID=83615 RepID=UPI00047B410B|nr:hypothetical protein [Luteimonas mephitis]